MSGRAEEPSTVEAVALLLPVPDLARVSDAQFRGAACAWCAVTLSPATAVDLGPRRIRRLDGHLTIHPRGCRACAAERVPAVQQGHSSMCEQCADAPGICATARALRHLEMTVTR